MNKKSVRKFIAVLCVLLVAATCFTGCKEKDADPRSAYTITATVDAENMTVSATCNVHYVNRTQVELDEVWFHLYPAAYRDGARFTPVNAAEIESAYPGGISYGGIEITAVSGGEYAVAGKDEDILTVKLPKAIMPTESAEITIEYTLKLPHMRHRMGYENGCINLGNWFPIECAYDNGFVDDPYYDSGDPFNLPVCDYDVTVTAPKRFAVATSGRSTRTEGETEAVTHSGISRARDFAVVLGAFEKISDTVDGVEVTYYFTGDSDPQKHLKAATEALHYFSSSFGQYPYETYSVVQTPFNQGGMEYSGLVYVSDAVKGDMITEVIVHETAHQWWYGTVGNDQVNEAWLDESLAEYSTTLFYEHHPDYGVSYDARIADAMGGFTLYCELSKCSDTSMNRSLSEYASSTEYSYMTYVKGQLLYDSLNKLIGEEKLVAGLRNYASKCAYKTAHTDDLIACLEKSGKRDLKSFVMSYVDGTAKLYSIS